MIVRKATNSEEVIANLRKERKQLLLTLKNCVEALDPDFDSHNRILRRLGALHVLDQFEDPYLLSNQTSDDPSDQAYV